MHPNIKRPLYLLATVVYHQGAPAPCRHDDLDEKIWQLHAEGQSKHSECKTSQWMQRMISYVAVFVDRNATCLAIKHQAASITRYVPTCIRNTYQQFSSSDIALSIKHFLNKETSEIWSHKSWPYITCLQDFPWPQKLWSLPESCIQVWKILKVQCSAPGMNLAKTFPPSRVIDWGLAALTAALIQDPWTWSNKMLMKCF